MTVVKGVPILESEYRYSTLGTDSQGQNRYSKTLLESGIGFTQYKVSVLTMGTDSPSEYWYAKTILEFPGGEFEMSMMGELSFFLGLQIKQRKNDTFINQTKYIKEKLKKFGLENVKPQATPMSSFSKLDKDEGDVDCGGCKIERAPLASSSNPNGVKPNLNVIFNECFNKLRDPEAMKWFKEFQNYRILCERRAHIPFLNSAAFNFRYLDQLRQWKLLPYLRLFEHYYHNLVLIFYSNA
ncbi:hypothetical protein V6N12_049006 [Hibiscus sabdariffa]|uniref:Reverse transcriptase Ty1/copia-type domain-containing protein n=1 Tax=Hibiscus sabdariffa TaxID=183260 RepID=A0ABR2EJB2_9ROSI